MYRCVASWVPICGRLGQTIDLMCIKEANVCQVRSEAIFIEDYIQRNTRNRLMAQTNLKSTNSAIQSNVHELHTIRSMLSDKYNLIYVGLHFMSDS